jgi:hypothetical protein
VTLSELAIEMFFPADENTAAALKREISVAFLTKHLKASMRVASTRTRQFLVQCAELLLAKNKLNRRVCRSSLGAGEATDMKVSVVF